MFHWAGHLKRPKMAASFNSNWRTFFFYLIFAILYATPGLAEGEKSRSEDMCMRIFDVSNRTIIKASESIQQGATYLNSAPVQSRLDCQKQCCSVIGCNVAVFEEKPATASGDCFMFDCGTLKDFKCVFTPHDHYVSMGMMINRNDLEKTRTHDQARHEMDLNLLQSQNNVNNPGGDSIATSTTAVAPPAKVRPPSEDISMQQYSNQLKNSNANQNPQAIFSDKSVDNPQKVFDNSVPAASYDRQAPQPPPPPQQQQQQSNSVEKTSCRKVQWQCVQSLECIAIYDVCNGIAQCRDKSDEFYCGDSADQVNNQQPQDQYQQPPVQNGFRSQDGNYANQQQQQAPQQGSDGNNRWWQGPDPSQNQLKIPNRQGYYQVEMDSNAQQPIQNPNGPSVSRETLPLISRPKGSFEQAQAQQQAAGNPAPKKPALKSVDANANANSAAVAQNVKSVKLQPKVEEIHRGSTNLAALFLGLGISLLAITGVYISLRIRSARRRIRRGKPLHDGEGDYLINGLYL